MAITTSSDKDFILMNKTSIKNPAGGWTDWYSPGDTFRGKYVPFISDVTKIAQAETGTDIGSFGTDISNEIPINSVIYDPDEKVYIQILNNGQRSSAMTGANVIQYNAKKLLPGAINVV